MCPSQLTSKRRLAMFSPQLSSGTRSQALLLGVSFILKKWVCTMLSCVETVSLDVQMLGVKLL
jgi:hypothetical protein